MSEIMVVMSVVLIIWVGLFLYLMRLDRQVKHLEKGENR
jgi:CcmD family protein